MARSSLSAVSKPGFVGTKKQLTPGKPKAQPMYPGKPSTAGKTPGQYGTGMVQDNKTYGPYKGSGRKVGRMGPDNDSSKTYTRNPNLSKAKGFNNDFSDMKGGSGRPVGGTQRGQ